jgi:chemotaxis protein MotB
MTQQTLEFQAGDENSAGGRQQQRGTERGGQSQSTADEMSAQAMQEAQDELEQASQDQVKELVKKIASQLEEQIQDGAIEVDSLGQQVIIRIRENGSFPSGSAFLQPQFKPIMKAIAELLTTVPGEIMVSGHTDNQGISSELFSSNWDLSSKRAVAIAHELVKVEDLEQSRLLVVGHAETRPLVPNTNTVNRRKNRRVEISINQGKAKETEPYSVIKTQ